MKYSVITISWNSEETIERTIQSIFSQSVLPYEYIFVDGGSDDRTLSIIEAMMSKFRDAGVKTQLIKQPRGGGIAHAWNMGIRAARGEWIFILNSDDWYDSNCAERVSKAAAVRADADLIVGSTRLYDDSADTAGTLHRSRSACLFPFLNPINHPACFIKKTVYDEIGYYSEDYRVASDYDFLYRCAKVGKKIVRDSDIIVERMAGGYAEQNKVTSRQELRSIGKKYCKCSFLPEIAYRMRCMLGR